MYNVSSSFIYRASAHNAAWRRKFTLGTSDYSNHVMGWPAVSRSWDSISPTSVTINLSNNDRTFNFFLTDGTKLHASAAVQMGLIQDNYVVDGYVVDGYVLQSDVVSGDYIDVIAGTIDSLQFANNQCAATVIDKFKTLTTKIVGDTTSPASYTGSSYLVHDLAWYVCTSHGGLSALTSTSNPDIDYASFSSWTSVFSADNVRMKAQFTGQQPSDILKRIAAMTQSAIWIESNRVKFVRFTVAGESSLTFDDSITIDGSQVMDERSLVNKFYVGAAYDTTSRTYGITVNDSNSSSISRYGLKEKTSNEALIWYVDSGSALNLAQRMVLTGKEIFPRLQINTPLTGIHLTIGDTLTISDTHLQSSDNYRVMSETLDMENGKKSFTVDQTQFLSGFTLDVSALDSSEVLT